MTKTPVMRTQRCVRLQRAAHDARRHTTTVLALNEQDRQEEVLRDVPCRYRNRSTPRLERRSELRRDEQHGARDGSEFYHQYE
jgi:hypothetical protein